MDSVPAYRVPNAYSRGARAFLHARARPFSNLKRVFAGPSRPEPNINRTRLAPRTAIDMRAASAHTRTARINLRPTTGSRAEVPAAVAACPRIAPGYRRSCARGPPGSFRTEQFAADEFRCDGVVGSFLGVLLVLIVCYFNQVVS